MSNSGSGDGSKVRIFTGGVPERWAPGRPKTGHGVYEAARDLKPGQWYVRPPAGKPLTAVSVPRICAGANRWMRRRGVQAAAFGHEQDGELVVVVAWAAVPGDADSVPQGDHAVAAALEEWTPTRTDAEKAAERARLERKLSGRGPVAGFDSPGKSGRARAIRNTESEE